MNLHSHTFVKAGLDFEYSGKFIRYTQVGAPQLQPEPIRGTEGASIINPTNLEREPKAATGSRRRAPTTVRFPVLNGPLR
jgi:hypothetical protein